MDTSKDIRIKIINILYSDNSNEEKYIFIKQVFKEYIETKKPQSNGVDNDWCGDECIDNALDTYESRLLEGLEK